jgi:Rrf2 family nitric oxide-sensitive transcriptional repressor
MFSQTVEYALRAIVYLASRPDSAQTTPQIALVTKVPADYLSKVLQGLAAAGLVRGRRGRDGGFNLAIPADRLTVYDVIEAVDPIGRIKSCPLGLKGHINLCPLHRRLDAAMAMMEAALRESTIAELLIEPNSRKGIPIPLCEDA